PLLTASPSSHKMAMMGPRACLLHRAFLPLVTLVLASVCVLSGCFNFNPDNGFLSCSESKVCPEGYFCGADGLCYRQGAALTTPDASSDSASPGMGCQPTTCEQAGANCGIISDGCGAVLNCGHCDSLLSCGGGGQRNVCGCTPLTCASQNAECGHVS